MNLDQSARVALVADHTRLKRIDRVYATARFMNKHLYGVFAVGLVPLILVMMILFRFLARQMRRL